MGDAPKFFASAAAFRRWLAANHDRAAALVVGLRKVHVKPQGLTYAQALDEALCFGWIDGIRRSLGADTFTIRFTPRKRGSIWSLVNVRHVERLTREGRMQPSGLAAHGARDEKRTGIYAFENRPAEFDAASARTFRRHAKAWTFFAAQPPGYRRTATFWVTSAKREETRARRLATLIEDSANGRRLAQLARQERPTRQRR